MSATAKPYRPCWLRPPRHPSSDPYVAEWSMVPQELLVPNKPLLWSCDQSGRCNSSQIKGGGERERER